MSLSVGASCVELAQTGTIVGPREFCALDPIDLAFTVKAPWLKDDHITVTDIHGKSIFWSGERFTLTHRSRQILCDTKNNPLICMEEQTWSVHKRWQVFTGDSSHDGDLLFTVKKSAMFQKKPELEVFLASNTGQEVSDFKIKGSYPKRTCTVYKGDSQMALARMSKEHKAMNLPQGEDIFGVHINPNTDYCFIAALVVILHKIHDRKNIREIAADIGKEIIIGGAIGEFFSD